MKSVISTLLMTAVLGLPAPGLAASLRCGTRLVSDGASQAEVVSRCGEPASKTTRKEAVRTSSGTGDDLVVLKTFEDWTYNFGPYRLLQTVTFENGVLIDVRSGNYGY